MLANFHLADIDCLLRAPTLEKTRLYRYLEDGATGLMIPHVSTAEKAKSLVESVEFPPIGDRGIDGAGLDSDFYLQGDGDAAKPAVRTGFDLRNVTYVSDAHRTATVASGDTQAERRVQANETGA